MYCTSPAIKTTKGRQKEVSIGSPLPAPMVVSAALKLQSNSPALDDVQIAYRHAPGSNGYRADDDELK